MSRMSENVGASTSRNPKGLHGLYRDNFSFIHKFIKETVYWNEFQLRKCLSVIIRASFRCTTAEFCPSVQFLNRSLDLFLVHPYTAFLSNPLTEQLCGAKFGYFGGQGMRSSPLSSMSKRRNFVSKITRFDASRLFLDGFWKNAGIKWVTVWMHEVQFIEARALLLTETPF
jgi:hypothetical protein